MQTCQVSRIERDFHSWSLHLTHILKLFQQFSHLFNSSDYAGHGFGVASMGILCRVWLDELSMSSTGVLG